VTSTRPSRGQSTTRSVKRAALAPPRGPEPRLSALPIPRRSSPMPRTPQLRCNWRAKRRFLNRLRLVGSLDGYSLGAGPARRAFGSLITHSAAGKYRQGRPPFFSSTRLQPGGDRLPPEPGCDGVHPCTSLTKRPSLLTRLPSSDKSPGRPALHGRRRQHAAPGRDVRTGSRRWCCWSPSRGSRDRPGWFPSPKWRRVCVPARLFSLVRAAPVSSARLAKGVHRAGVAGECLRCLACRRIGNNGGRRHRGAGRHRPHGSGGSLAGSCAVARALT
jgi:hypothetical protein